MTPTLESLLDRGRRYVTTSAAIAEVRPARLMQDVAERANRIHSSEMRDLALEDAEALLAAVLGAVKWHERQHADGRHLGDALLALEDAASSLRKHWQDEEAPSCPLPVPFAEPVEPELPLVRAA